jgi:hypothetical protein
MASYDRSAVVSLTDEMDGRWRGGGEVEVENLRSLFERAKPGQTPSSDSHVIWVAY